MSRSFRYGPGRAVRVNASIANLLNRANLVNMNGVLTSPAFGTANRALSPRRIDLSVAMSF